MWAILFAIAVPVLALFIREVPLRGAEPAEATPAAAEEIAAQGRRGEHGDRVVPLTTRPVRPAAQTPTVSAAVYPWVASPDIVAS